MAKKQQSSWEELLEQALVKDEDKPYEVPANWVWVRLDSIGKVKGGKRLPQGHSLQEIRTSHPYIRVVDFDNGSINVNDLKYIADETYSCIRNYTISKDDIYISIAGTIGKVVFVPDYLDGANLTENAAKIVINHKIATKEYLCHLLDSQDMQLQIKSSTIATTQAKLALFRICALYLPLPPLPEQQRIVALIEPLFEKLDRAKEIVQNALDSFENRKSAVLHKAFAGELTRQWSKENGVEIERDWPKKRFEECVLSLQNGISKRGGITGVDTVVLRLANILDNRIVEDDLRYIRLEEKEADKYILKNNDILIIRVNGSLSNVGKFIMIQDENNWAYCDHMIRARTLDDVVIAKYVIYFSLTNDFKGFVQNNIVSSAGQNTISQKSLNELQVPVPSLAEQREIVRILDNLLENEQKAKDLCDVIEKIDHIKKTILARAFRGELGTNDPAEESAVELFKEVLMQKV